MTNNFSCKLAAKLAFLIVCLPLVTNAQQYFTDTSAGDVNSGFRKTGSYEEQDEMVTYLGNISNFLAMAAGTTTNISFYTNQLATMCPDGLGNLQWSVFASFQTTGPLTNSLGVWPVETCWYTVPRTNVNVQTTPISRLSYSSEGTGLREPILAVSGNAFQTSVSLYNTDGNTNADNNSLLVLEPVNYLPQYLLTAAIGDASTPSLGDFGGVALDFSVENVTSNSFTSPVVSDFYANVPEGHGVEVDPITGATSGNADYLGYFTLNPNGTMSFTRASAAPAVSGITASATNGFGPLTVVFTNSTSGGITNWVWNFGNGTTITNTTGGSVTNIYTTAGSYTVTLTVYGLGGSSTETIANFIVTSPKPKIILATPSGKVVLNGSNCPSGVQYRILTSTNLTTTLPNWKPIYTNTFASNGTFSYTNSIGGTNTFFIMVSP